MTALSALFVGILLLWYRMLQPIIVTIQPPARERREIIRPQPAPGSYRDDTGTVEV